MGGGGFIKMEIAVDRLGEGGHKDPRPFYSIKISRLRRKAGALCAAPLSTVSTNSQ